MKTLLFILTLILGALLFGHLKFNEVPDNNDFNLKNNLFLALCSDGEISEGAAYDFIMDFQKDPVRSLEMIKTMNSEIYTYVNYKYDCKDSVDRYLEPKFYNAVLTLIMSEYRGDHISELIKNQLIKYNQANTDPDLDYLIKELIKI